ncbi:MAG: outer membrane protein transport protein [Myxococcales bacterium]|nr:outer membrane protein transport protein [Myxococcales bacterium]
MHGSRRLWVTLTLLASALWPTWAYSGGTSFDTNSASVAARGWAVTADLDDPSVVWFNPGGMGFQKERFNIMAGVCLVVPRIKYSDPEGNRPSSNGTNRFTAVPNLYIMGNFGSERQFSWGLSVVLPFGLASKYESDWTGSGLVTLSELRSIFISPSFSYRINKYVSLGASLNLVLATIRLNRALQLPGPDGVIGGTANLGGGPTFAVGGTFGIQARYKGLRLGFVYHSRTKMKFKGKADFNAPEPYNAGLLDQDIKATLGTPDNMWLGIGYHITNKVYLELDVRVTLWKYVSKEIVLEFEKPLNGTLDQQVIKQDWRNAWTFYVGGYAKPIPELTVRFGTGFDLTPIPSYSLGPLVPDANRFLLSGGLGYEHIKSGFYTDVAYNLVLMIPRTVLSTESQDGFAQKWKNVIHLVTINLGWKYL